MIDKSKKENPAPEVAKKQKSH